MTIKQMIPALVLAGLAMPALAQSADDPQAMKTAYIDGAFHRMDTDGSGQVDRAEFERFMEARIALQKARFDTAYTAADKNGDGKLDKGEASASNALLAENFDRIDSDKDGFVTADEIRRAILAAQADDLPEN